MDCMSDEQVAARVLASPRHVALLLLAPCCHTSHSMRAQVVDTTGAGDTFTAAYAVALLEGCSQENALRLAGVSCSCAPSVV